MLRAESGEVVLICGTVQLPVKGRSILNARLVLPKSSRIYNGEHLVLMQWQNSAGRWEIAGVYRGWSPERTERLQDRRSYARALCKPCLAQFGSGKRCSIIVR